MHKHPQPLFGQMFYSSPLLLTSNKWLVEAWFGLFVRWKFYAAKSIQWTFIALSRTSAWEATTNAVKPSLAFLLEAKYSCCTLSGSPIPKYWLSARGVFYRTPNGSEVWLLGLGNWVNWPQISLMHQSMLKPRVVGPASLGHLTVFPFLWVGNNKRFDVTQYP